MAVRGKVPSEARHSGALEGTVESKTKSVVTDSSDFPLNVDNSVLQYSAQNLGMGFEKQFCLR